MNVDDGGQTRKIPEEFLFLSYSDFEEHELCFDPIVVVSLAHSSFQP